MVHGHSNDKFFSDDSEVQDTQWSETAMNALIVERKKLQLTQANLSFVDASLMMQGLTRKGKKKNSSRNGTFFFLSPSCSPQFRCIF